MTNSKWNPKNIDIYVLLILLTITLALGFSILRPFLRPIVFAIIIGIGFYPIHEEIRKRIPRRNISSLVSTLIVLLIFLIPTVILASRATGDVLRAARHIDAKTEADGGLFAYLLHLLDRPAAWLGKYIDLETTGIAAALDSLPARLSRLSLAAARPLFRGLVGFVREAVITLLVLFFVFRDGIGAAAGLASLLPMRPGRAERLFSLIHESIVANLYGILTVAVLQGSLAGLAFAIVGIRPLLLLMVATASFSLVPIVGSAIVWLPVSIFLFATGHAWKGVFVIAWCVIVVGIADNIIRPLVVAGRIRLHPLVLLFALIGGAEEFGILGLFIGPIVMSVIGAIVNMLHEEITEAPQPSELLGTPSAPS